MRAYLLSRKNLTRKLSLLCDENIKSKNTITSIVRGNAIEVSSFYDLIMEIAELSYRNPDVMLFYRGQNNNYTKHSIATLYPTIYRATDKSNINFDFKVLNEASIKLIAALKADERIDSEELKEIRKIKLLQYSILQHYEVCKTPLLDLTQSIKVACSFAILNNKNDIGYIYVLGLPYINGRISVDSEEYITNVRLLSISSSAAKRPFFQEGYLVQTEFASDIENNIKMDELDFNRRLLAIYKFKNDQQFWGEERPISENALYPNDDIMKEICNKIKDSKYYLSNKTTKNTNTKLLGDFLTLWSNIETYYNYKNKNTNNNTDNNLILNKSYVHNESYLRALQAFRNKVVHKPELIKDDDLIKNINILKSLFDNKKI
jgi:FRG domain protein